MEAKSLIARILHLNPSFRPSLDDILSHEFFHNGNTIPKLLPTSTLACAPSNTMLKQFTREQELKPFTKQEGISSNIDKPIDINTRINANTERNNQNEFDKL